MVRRYGHRGDPGLGFEAVIYGSLKTKRSCDTSRLARQNVLAVQRSPVDLIPTIRVDHPRVSAAFNPIIS